MSLFTIPDRRERKPKGARLVGAFAAVLVGATFTSNANALSFFPKRIMLDDQKRATVLRIVNKDDIPRRYIITWHRMRMTRDRGLRPVAEDDPAPELKPARDYVLFGPRQAVVPPGSTQAVRLMAQPPADLAPGEYRSHLMITQPPRQSESGDGADAADDVQMQLEVVHRTTMPVILRHGDPEAEVAVAAMFVGETGQGPQLDVTLARSGERSIYMNATVIWETPDGERHRVFGPATTAIYPEIERREYSHRLQLPEGRSLDGGTLHYVLKQYPVHGGPSPVLAERRIRVP